MSAQIKLVFGAEAAPSSPQLVNSEYATTTTQDGKGKVSLDRI
jgi:hypothetical protein